MDALSAEHLAVVLVTAAVAAVAVPAARTHPLAVCRTLAVVLGATYAVEHADFILRGDWDADFNLPLHLTDAVTLVSVAALWTARPLLVELTYFWGLTASLQAILTPDLGTAAAPDLLFWTFFVTHAGAVIAALVLTVGRRIAPRPGAVLRVFAITAAFAALAAAANAITGGNYMFLREKPGEPTLLDVLGPWPVYIAVAAAIGLALFALLDLPFQPGRRRRADPARS